LIANSRKILGAQGRLATLAWALTDEPERTKTRERLYYERYFSLRPPASWTWKARHGTKIY